MDSTTLMMGKIARMHVEVEEAPGLRGHFPLFASIMEVGYVGVCGDSVEYRAPAQVDTVTEGNKRIIRFDMPVQSFDSGTYVLPALAYVSGVDTTYSNRLQLKVLPVSGVTADTPIDDYANVSAPENQSIFDAVPDWMIKYWWILLIVLLAVAAFVYGWLRYRKEGHLLPQKPEPTPYETAMAGLKALKEKKLWEQGMEKEYFTELTDIVRVYLDGRFGINAMEMTSRQILQSLGANREIKDKRTYIRQILDMADFVKFAKVRPLPADNIASYDNALKFVEETKPVPEEENAEIKERKEVEK